MEHVIRAATEADLPIIFELVHDLARYERAPDAVEATLEDFAAALWGPTPVAWCHLAEEDGTIMGFALWYLTFSTWQGRPGLWLEDLYVRPTARGRGIGRALLEQLAALCRERGYRRFEWWVLDWNTDAHGFYRSLGAAPQEEWTVWRLDGEALAGLGPASTGESAAGRSRPQGSTPRG